MQPSEAQAKLFDFLSRLIGTAGLWEGKDDPTRMRLISMAKLQYTTIELMMVLENRRGLPPEVEGIMERIREEAQAVGLHFSPRTPEAAPEEQPESEPAPQPTPRNGGTAGGPPSGEASPSVHESTPPATES